MLKQIKLWMVFLIFFSFFIAPQSSALTAYQQNVPEPKYEVRLEKSHMVPMRDGIRLSTDLYFPQNADKKLPVILIRTPYNKKDYREQRARSYMFVSHGFLVALLNDLKNM